jgi:four helix bundle protein
MGEEFNFKKLEVYQISIGLVQEIYQITKSWSREYLFDLTSQIRRAGLSIPLNIAEGSSRTKKDFKRFLDISRGSIFECSAILEIAKTENLLDDVQYNQMSKKLIRISKMTSGLKKSLNS